MITPLSIKQALVVSVMTHVGCVIVLGWPPVIHPWQFGVNSFFMGSYITSFIIFGIQGWLKEQFKRQVARQHKMADPEVWERLHRRAKQGPRPDPNLN